MTESKATVELRAKPGKTIHLGITPGVAGDKNKNIPPRAPTTQVIQPMTIFKATKEQADNLIANGAAMLVSDEKKVKTAQQLTDESAAAAAAAAADEAAAAAAADEAAAAAAKKAAAAAAKKAAAAPTLPTPNS